MIEDGITYTYKSKKEEAAVLEERYEQSVYGYTDFNKVVTKADVPATKRVTVTNEKTGLKETVTCNLSGIHPLTPVWESTYIDITFETYDADAYVWNGEVVEKNADPALDETKLLASVGADERTYKVKRIYWNGEAYEENGVLCRKARADVQRLTTYYRASYDGMIIEEEIPGVKYILTYEGKQADGEAAGYIYEIEGTAVYKRDNITVFIAVGAGILIVAAGIVGILFLIAKKKQENEEKNHTKGEIL